MASPLNQMIQTPLCTFCKEEKITEWICLDCEKPLCYGCKRYHLWDYENLFHDIVRAVPLDRGNHDKQSLKKINCKDHEDHYCTNYCIECQCLVCPECVSLNSCHMGHTFKTINTIHEETLKKLESEENCIKQNLLPSVTRKLKSLDDWSTLHHKLFEEEKEKVLKRADELKKWITECSDNLVNELTKTLVKNADVISQEKVKLEQLQGELKEKIKLINESKVKDDIEQILIDVSYKITNIKHFDIPLFIPREAKKLSTAKETEESVQINKTFGSLQNYDATAHVDCKITNPYSNLICLNGTCDDNNYYNQRLVAMTSDETLAFADGCEIRVFKPDKSPTLVQFKSEITDMFFLETNELVIAVDNSIQVKNEHGEIRTLYTLQEKEQIILAVCGNVDGNIMILYSQIFDSFMLGRCYVDIKVISGNGDLVKTISCEEQFSLCFRFPIDNVKQFRITEGIDKDVVIVSILRNVKAISQDGKLRWKQNIDDPIDVKSTPLGSIIVLCKSGLLLILNSSGNFVKKIDIKGTFCSSRLCPSFCFKNDKELAIVNGEEVHIAQFSLIV